MKKVTQPLARVKLQAEAPRAGLGLALGRRYLPRPSSLLSTVRIPTGLGPFSGSRPTPHGKADRRPAIAAVVAAGAAPQPDLLVEFLALIPSVVVSEARRTFGVQEEHPRRQIASLRRPGLPQLTPVEARLAAAPDKPTCLSSNRLEPLRS